MFRFMDQGSVMPEFTGDMGTFLVGILEAGVNGASHAFVRLGDPFDI